MSVHNLYYFAIPGKAEMIRVALHVSGLTWENHIVNGESWKTMKAGLVDKLPQANIPLLEIDGQYLTESLAILRYVGTMGGMVPEAPVEQMAMDEGLNMSNDIFSCFAPTFGISDPAERLAARQALCAADGQLYKIMQKFDSVVATFNGGYMAGNMLTVGDLCWFATFGLISCGMIDGFPPTYLDQFPNISNYRKFIGTNPKVASRYANETEGLLFNGFKF